MKKIIYLLIALCTVSVFAENLKIVESIKELANLPKNVSSVVVKSFHQKLNNGGGTFYFDMDMPQILHNGGTIIAKDKKFPLTWDTQNQVSWFDHNGLSGKGCWVKIEKSLEINVREWGAKNKVDCTPSLNAIMRTVTRGDKTAVIYFPKGEYSVSSWLINRTGIIKGAGIDVTYINPLHTVPKIKGQSTFILASDNITVTEMTFQARNHTGNIQNTDLYGSCIEINAFNHNPKFLRHLEGINITRVKFRNLKMNGIYASQIFRESFIDKCRFVGIGDKKRDTSPIKFEQHVGTPSHINNIWITRNSIYRFATPAIYGKKSTLIKDNKQSYSTLYIENNLIHGQALDEKHVKGVVPEKTDHIYFENIGFAYIRGNTITAIHPEYCGIHLKGPREGAKKAVIYGNAFSNKSIVQGVRYRRSDKSAIGSNVRATNFWSINIGNNSVYGGVFIYDFYIQSISAKAKAKVVDINILNNTSQAGDISTFVPSNWRGTYQSNKNIFSKKRIVSKKIKGIVVIQGKKGSAFVEFKSKEARNKEYSVLFTTETAEAAKIYVTNRTKNGMRINVRNFKGEPPELQQIVQWEVIE